jgi:beta-lactamase class A
MKITAKQKRTLSALIFAILFIFVGIISDRVYNIIMAARQNDSGLYETRQSSLTQTSYKFIDPLLFCGVSLRKEATEFALLKTQIQNLISDKEDNNQVKTVSVYVNFDSRDGRWLSINPNEVYSPASLFKVPTAIAYLKLSESNPNILTSKLYYDGKINNNSIEYFKPSRAIGPRSLNTVDALIQSMLRYSDNNAYYVLQSNINPNTYNELLTDLGIVLPQSTNIQNDFITIKQYANFFRVLYNASYLDRDMSEKALSYLSQTDFNQGIVAGLPNNLVVAHKFGERIFGNDPLDPASQKELHDCGIIYYPNHPYLLCVMTKGTNFENLAGTISDISKTVYQYIDQEYK